MNPTVAALADHLARFDRLVEVGIGRRTAVAAALADSGSDVTATDIHPRPVPAGVAFVRDDLTDPDFDIYADAEAVYGLNLPRELHRPARDLAHETGAKLLFTTLGAEFPGIEATPETIPGETLYRPTERGRSLQWGEHA